MVFPFSREPLLLVYLQAVVVVRLHMTKRWLIALLIAGLFAGKAFADCVPSPDTPASVIEYFQKLNKPLPEKFCAKEDAAPRASEKPSRREPPQASEQPSQEPPQADEDAPPQLERRGLPPEYLPIPEPRYPPPYGAWSRLAVEWLYSELRRHHHKNHKHKHHKHKHDHDDND
jgi:hypothetical protein